MINSIPEVEWDIGGIINNLNEDVNVNLMILQVSFVSYSLMEKFLLLKDYLKWKRNISTILNHIKGLFFTRDP